LPAPYAAAPRSSANASRPLPAAAGAPGGGGTGGSGGACAAPDAAPTLAQALPARAEIDAAHKWRLEDIYPDDAAWERDFAELQARLPSAAGHRGRLGDGPEALLAALTARDAMSQALERLFAYAQMKSDEDTRVSAYQAAADRVGALATQLDGAWAWFEPELLALPEGTVRAWMESPAAAPSQPQQAISLSVYRHKLDDLLRQKPHVLSAAEEELLARAGEIARAPQTMESKSRAVREEAFRTLYATYGKQRHTLGSILGSSVKRDWFYAQARRYGSCLDAALDGDNIPAAVYANLIAAVRANLPALHRYLRLRRRALGVDRLHMYDLYVPLVEEPQQHVAWDEAVRAVAAGLAPLGPDYVRRYTAGTSAGWVDVFENQGKTGGAYSWGVYGVHPFVLMNYQGTIDHVFTLAHEFGHALHSSLTNETQPYPYANYSIFVAEVASTVNEALLMHHLLEQATEPRQRAYLVNHYLEGFRTTVYRQVMFAEFEKIIHEKVEKGEALTADALSAAYRDLNLAYYGPETEVDAEIDLEWARIPHFYRAFYVYKYATGFSAAQALAQAVRREGAPARERYLGFLRGGSSRYPVDLLRGAGVDMASPEPVNAALGIFGRLVEELEGLLG
jgi:oligoendopeptidase F